MKKILGLGLLVSLLVSACGTKNDENVIKVSATAVPHAEILEFARDILKEEYGYDLEIIVTDDYYVPNAALDNGDVDANYFQHEPFFNEQVEVQGYNIVNAAGIHLEPIGIYSNTYKSIDDIKENATIIISNSTADQARILNVLADNGLITLDSGVDRLTATLEDIKSNPLNIDFKAQVAPELLITTFNNNEADLVAINSNYALQGGLNPLEDSLLIESSVNNPYVNIIAVQKGHENDEKIVALIEVLQSEKVKEFILSKYEGAVIPA